MSDTDTDELEKMSDEERAMMSDWEDMADEDGSGSSTDATPAFDGGGDDGGARILNQ